MCKNGIWKVPAIGLQDQEIRIQRQKLVQGGGMGFWTHFLAVSQRTGALEGLRKRKDDGIIMIMG